MYESQNIGHFIGRAEEISIFERWLRDPEGPWILYVHDAIEDHEKKGGIGKTWLLRRYAELVQQQYPEIGIVQADFFNVADRDRVFLTQKVVAGLQRLYPSWAATLFNKAIQTRDIGEQFTNSMTTSAVREAVIDALSEDLRRLEAQLEEEQRMLLIFFDTFETIERNPTVAVLRQRQTFPDTYQLPHVRVVIAGRNQLDWNHINWRGRQSEIRALPLHPFSPQEMLLYIQNESFYDIPATSEQARALYARTEGRPIMIGLAIDVLNNRIQRLDELVSVSQSDFERYLVRQINKLENPLNWVILFMAHIYHSFNLPILDWILQRVQMNAEVKAVDPADLTRRLPRLSFVRRASANDNFTLHDEMRRLVVRYCWEDLDPDRRYRKSLSNSVISYFEEQLKGNITEQQRQTYIVEMLYHRLYIDPQDGFRFFQENITQAMRQSKTAFARLMVQEVQPFAELLSRDDRSDILLTEARITRYEKEASASLAFLNRLREEASADWLEAHQTDILWAEGRCFVLLGKYREAAEDFLTCLPIEQARGNVGQSFNLLANLGLVSRYRGEYTKALEYYEQGIEICKRMNYTDAYASILGNMSSVYRRQGRIDEALSHAKVAWRIRQELFAQGKIDEVSVGLTLHLLGQAYLEAGKYNEAERSFDRVYDIYLRNNYKIGFPVVFNRYGQLNLSSGKLEVAQEWFKRAVELSEGVNSEQYINSLNRLGRICLKREQWREAIALFEQAIAAAVPVPDYYQQVENKLDLADAVSRIGDYEKSQQLFAEAEAMARVENYVQFLAQVEQRQAELEYRRGEYHEAFRHYALYCQRLAEYNHTAFIAAVQYIVDVLLDIPRSQVAQVVQDLKSYWTELQLNEKYPELVQAIEEIDSLMLP